jgi:hypothetical protein
LKKNRFIIVVYIILILFLGLPIHLRDLKADIILVHGMGTGNFLPEENNPLIMTNASVNFNIDSKTYLSRININFTGNYTIYNPGKSISATLVAPFSSDFKNLESSCVIKIDNVIIDYKFLGFNISGYPWDEYLEWSLLQNRDFLIINATFPENDSIMIQYSFNAYIDNMQNYQILNILYDVGTSRAWNGSISERVEFKVYGKLPDSYSSYREDSFEYNCTISEIEDGKSYMWEWKDEIINVNSVYISYSYYNPWWRLFPFIFFPLFIGIPIIVAVIVIRKTKRKKYRV